MKLLVKQLKEIAQLANSASYLSHTGSSTLKVGDQSIRVEGGPSDYADVYISTKEDAAQAAFLSEVRSAVEACVGLKWNDADGLRGNMSLVSMALAKYDNSPFPNCGPCDGAQVIGVDMGFKGPSAIHVGKVVGS